MVNVPTDLSKLSVLSPKMKMLKKMCMMNRLKKLMPLILVDSLKKQIMTLQCINESKSEISSITGLATRPAFNAVKDDIPKISVLVRKRV